MSYAIGTLFGYLIGLIVIGWIVFKVIKAVRKHAKPTQKS